MTHAGYHLNTHIKIHWISSEKITESNVNEVLSGLDGIIVPGGFGNRGIDGMIITAKYARENDIPYFGICLGMQVQAIEFARNVCGLTDASSHEFNPESTNRVIDYLPGQNDSINKGGTLRLGAYPCVIKENTLLYKCYKEKVIKERHRHRYEFNNDYREIFTSHKMVFGGTSPDSTIIETIELPSLKFNLGVQFHPEFKSRPNRPHPIFLEFIRVSLENALKR